MPKANYYKDCLSTDFKNSKKFWINSITNKSTKSHSGPISIQNRCGSSFCFKSISPTDVQWVIDSLSSGCSAGPDGLDTKFFKLASHVLSFPLADLFNLSFASCEIPLSWKSARVIPLHKGGDTSDTNNYRPISIINSIAKIF